MQLDKIKENIVAKLAETKPDTAAMFVKNWRRYKACIQFLEESRVLDKKMSILDYGCGHPLVSAILIELGYSVTPYEPFAGKGEQLSAELLGIGASFKTELDSTRVFDLVLMIDVIEHLSIIKPVMRDVNSKVRPGGFLLISTPNVMRAEMWLSFVKRETGHPQPLAHFLESDNNFVYHQREFTMAELNKTVKHFGFITLAKSCENTRPPLKDLNALRAIKGLPLKLGKGRSYSVKKILQNTLIFFFPKQMNNNLLLLAQKV